ncbi:MAG: 2-oxo acid dehydrogenase subunit E2 [Planctomyces sp.]|nr:2-oxo acid dehydrogenase subunit E2 [Planctomyces sp.]
MAHEIRVPRLGWSMEEGTFVGWLKRDGDPIQVGDALFELEGEKALQEIESVDAGILRIVSGAPQPGTVVAVGALMGYLVAEGEAVPATPGGAAPAPVAAPPPATPTQPTGSAPPASPAARRLARELGVDLARVSGSGPAGRITEHDLRATRAAPTNGDRPAATNSPGSAAVASPRARRIAAELGLDWTTMSGSGAGGRIREADVRAAAGRRSLSNGPDADGAGTVIALTPRRQAIAARLRTSRDQTIPVTLTATIDAAPLAALRAQFKASGAAIVPALIDIVACLVVPVLRQHRMLAGRWNAEQTALSLPADEGFHIGIAVDTADGLLVPVVRNVGGSTLMDVAARSRALIEQARAGRLTAAGMSGGVFTISNLGGLGVEAFTPMINVPEVAILGLGAIRPGVVRQPDGSAAFGDTLTISLTFDHAAIDGAPAAAFLRDLARALETPAASLLQ